MSKATLLSAIAALLLTCCGPNGSTGKSGTERLWSLFEIDGFWTEEYETVQELVDGADLVVLARIVHVEPGTRIQGDAAEDEYLEVSLDAAVVDVVRGEVTGDPLSVALTVTAPLSAAALSAKCEELNGNLDERPVLLVLRRRSSGAYRPVNGYGIWAATARARVDAPLNQFHPEQGMYWNDLRAIKSVGELAAYLHTLDEQD